MRAALVAFFSTVLALASCAAEYAQAQSILLPQPSERPAPRDLIYPDAIVCNVVSNNGVSSRMIFYKSQTVSFGTELNNVAEYGTPFIRDPDKFDGSVPNKWRLQLGQPGAITLFTLPQDWHSDDCPVGKSVKALIADKQALKIFVPQSQR
jgi:hypothetical protein